MRPCIVALDDDPDIRAFYAAVLDVSGFDVVLSDSSRNVLELVERYKPSLVITDLVMPDHEGMEGIFSLRSKSSVPILVVSAHWRFIDLARPMVNAVLTKPISTKQLLEAVQSILGGTGVSKTA